MWRKLGIAVGVLAALAAVGLGIAWWQANAVLDELQAGPKKQVVDAVEPELHRRPRHVLVPTTTEPPASGTGTIASDGTSGQDGFEPPLLVDPKAQTILLIGSDHRWDSGNQARSDTIILARVDPGSDRVALLSIPRDLYVAIPGHGHDRVNMAFDYGGEQLLTKTVREAFGVQIDHFVEIDFRGFKTMVDRLGGLYVPVDQRYFNENVGTPGTNYANIDLRPGYQRLDGTQALAFARYRHTDSDLVRASRQQLVLREAARQALEHRYDVLEVRSLINAFAHATTSDISSLKEVWTLVDTIRTTPSGNLVRLTVPGQDYSVGGASYLRASDAQLKRTVRRWLGAAPAPKPAAGGGGSGSKGSRTKRAAPTLAGDGGRGAALVHAVRNGIRTCAPTKLPPRLLVAGGRRRAPLRPRRPPGDRALGDPGRGPVAALDVHDLGGSARARGPDEDDHARRPRLRPLPRVGQGPAGRLADRADPRLADEHAPGRPHRGADAGARRLVPLAPLVASRKTWRTSGSASRSSSSSSEETRSTSPAGTSSRKSRRTATSSDCGPLYIVRSSSTSSTSSWRRIVSRSRSRSSGRAGSPSSSPFVSRASATPTTQRSDADHDRRALVPDRVAGQLVGRGAREGDDDAGDGGRVLRDDRLHRRLLADADELDEGEARLPRGRARLPDGADERDPLGEQREAERAVDEQEAALVGAAADDPEQPLRDREDAAGEEDHEGREQDPEEALPPVAEGMLLVGRPVGAGERDEQEALVGGVRDRVRGLGEQGRGAAQKPGAALDERDRRVGAERHEHGLPALAPGLRHGGRMTAAAAARNVRPDGSRSSSSE